MTPAADHVVHVAGVRRGTRRAGACAIDRTNMTAASASGSAHGAGRPWSAPQLAAIAKTRREQAPGCDLHCVRHGVPVPQWLGRPTAASCFGHWSRLHCDFQVLIDSDQVRDDGGRPMVSASERAECLICHRSMPPEELRPLASVSAGVRQEMRSSSRRPAGHGYVCRDDLAQFRQAARRAPARGREGRARPAATRRWSAPRRGAPSAGRGSRPSRAAVCGRAAAADSRRGVELVERHLEQPALERGRCVRSIRSKSALRNMQA